MTSHQQNVVDATELGLCPVVWIHLQKWGLYETAMSFCLSVSLFDRLSPVNSLKSVSFHDSTWQWVAAYHIDSDTLVQQAPQLVASPTVVLCCALTGWGEITVVKTRLPDSEWIVILTLSLWHCVCKMCHYGLGKIWPQMPAAAMSAGDTVQFNKACTCVSRQSVIYIDEF